MSDDYTKHAVTTDALDTLGEILEGPHGRDAIHLAVEQVVAGQRLAPGAHVRFDTDGVTAIGADVGEGVGIVDPFIDRIVELGDSFWLVVYPRQITTLRHVWEHPDFKPSGETDQAPPAVRTDKEALLEKAAAETWLRNWHAGIDYSVAFEELIRQLQDTNEEWIMSYGYDAHGEIPDEVYVHLATYTGQPIRDSRNRPSSFSCSC